MPTEWEEIEKRDDYQSLSPEGKRRLKINYDADMAAQTPAVQIPTEAKGGSGAVTGVAPVVPAPQVSALNVPPPEAAPAPPQAQERSSILRRAIADPLVSLGKGVVGTGEAVVGLADIATGGRAGQLMEEKLGYDPEETHKILSSWYSPEQKQALNRIEQAEGAWGTAKALVREPGATANMILESAPVIGLGGAYARGLKAMGWLGAKAAPFVGEGMSMAGSSAEEMRQSTPGGRLNAGQEAAALGIGFAGTLIAGAGGRLANKLGFDDVTQWIAGNAKVARKKGIEGAAQSVPELAYRLSGSGLIESAEEIGQTGFEVGLQNLAMGRPWDQGLDEALGKAGVLGGVMGVGMSGAQVGAEKLDAQMATERQPMAGLPDDILFQRDNIRLMAGDQVRVGDEKSSLSYDINKAEAKIRRQMFDGEIGIRELVELRNQDALGRRNAGITRAGIDNLIKERSANIPGAIPAIEQALEAGMSPDFFAGLEMFSEEVKATGALESTVGKPEKQLGPTDRVKIKEKVEPKAEREKIDLKEMYEEQVKATPEEKAYAGTQEKVEERVEEEVVESPVEEAEKPAERLAEKKIAEPTVEVAEVEEALTEPKLPKFAPTKQFNKTPLTKKAAVKREATFRKQVTRVVKDKKQADSISAILGARAKSLGYTTGEYLHQRGIEVKPGSKSKRFTYKQRQENKGAASIHDGKAIIHAFKSADASTVVHELAHVFRRDLTEQELQTSEKWAGVKKGEWTVEAEEKFATGFERYMRDGKAPNQQLKKVFAKLKKIFMEIYRTVKGSSVDIKLSPEITKVFDRILTGTGKAVPSKRAVFSREATLAQKGEKETLPERLADAVGKPEQVKTIKELGFKDEDGQIQQIVNDAVIQKVNIADMLEAKGRTKEAAKYRELAVENGKKLKDADGVVTEKAVDEALGDIKAKETPQQFTFKSGPVSVTVYKNPSPADYQAISIQFKDQFPLAPKGTPKYRSTIGTRGERYLWAAGDAMHSVVEGHLKDKYGIEANQNNEERDILFQAAERTKSEKNFKKWFGKSKVVDDDGEPLVVYHGSPEGNLRVFDPEKITMVVAGKGFYFAEKESDAQLFVEGAGKVYPVYLNISNPFDYNKKFSKKELKVLLGENYKDVIQHKTKTYKGQELPDSFHKEGSLYGQELFDKIAEYLGSNGGATKFLRKQGFDGIVLRVDDPSGDVAKYKHYTPARINKLPRNFIAFNPNQIKSIYNKGEWSKQQDDILFQAAERTKSEKNFKKFFGDSKVVDDEGEPLVVYHGAGSTKEITVFDPNKTFFRNGMIWFTPSKRYANDYGARGFKGNRTGRPVGKKKGHVIPVYLNVSNPLYATSVEFKKVQREFRLLKDTGRTSKNWGEFINSQGFDAYIPFEKIRPLHRVTEIAVFNPNQIKSIFNKGEWSKQQDDILFQHRDYTNEQLEVAKHGFASPEGESLRDKFERHHELWTTKFRQKVVDQYASFKEILGDDESWMMAHLAKSATDALMATVKWGRVHLESSGTLQLDQSKKSLQQILKPLGPEIDDFMKWMVGHRAEFLSKSNREMLFDKTQIKTLKTYKNGRMKDGRNRGEVFKQARKEFDEFSRDIVKVGVASGLINKKQAAQWAKDGTYIPFYRMLEQGGTKGPSSLSDLANQNPFEVLKGSDKKLRDPLSNSMMNWHHILTASLNNQAAKTALEAAESMSTGSEWIAKKVHHKKKSKDAIFVREDGNQIWYEINNTEEGKLVMESLLALDQAGMNDVVMRTGRFAKHWLTVGVTADPGFKIVNMLRDTIHTLAVGNVSLKFWKNVLTGLKTSTKTHDASGATFTESGYTHGAEPEAIKRLLKTGIDRDAILDTKGNIKKAISWWAAVGAKGENVNRIAAYNKTLEETGSLLKASFAARDLLDFTRTGSAHWVRKFTQVVPFMNARMQGLDKMARAGMSREQRMQFGAVITAYSLISSLMYLWMKDDEEYKDAEEWIKRTYHMFKFPGYDKMFYMPRPFEVGAVAYMSEKMTQQWAENEDKDFKDISKAMQHVIMDTFAMNPVPQALKPIGEVVADKNWFTGRDIEGFAAKYNTAEKTFKPWTSEVAKGASAVMGKLLPDKLTLSPVQIEHLVRAYTGWLGTTALAAADGIIRKATSKTMPDRKWYEQRYLPFRRFVHTTKNTKFMSAFYDNLEILTKEWGDIGDAAKGSPEKKELKAKFKDKKKYREEYNRVSRQLSKKRKKARALYKEKGITSVELRERMNKIKDEQNALVKRLVLKSKEAFR